LAGLKKNKLSNSLELGYIRYPKNGKKPVANSIMTGILRSKNKKTLFPSGIMQKIYNHIVPNIDLNRDAAKLLVLIDTLVKIYRNTLYVQYHISGIK